MRRFFMVSAALLAGASAALAGGSKLIRNRDGKPGRPTVNVPVAGDAPTGHAQGASPALYLAPDVLLATRASLDLGPAIPALRAAAGPQARLIFDPESGHVIRALDLAPLPPVPGSPAASALEFLRAHADAFGLPALPLESWLGDEVEGPAGERHYALQQHADDGVPIVGAIVTIHVDASGAPYLVQSEALPAPALFRPQSPIPRAAALARAGAFATGKVVAAEAKLVYFRPEAALVHRLSWQVDVGADRTFVDAETGTILERVDRRCYVNGTADVWDPNPLDGGVGPDDRDPNNTTAVTLTDLDGSGLLKGAVCNVVDAQHIRAGGAGGTDFTGYDPNPGAANPGPGGQEEFFEQISVYHYVVTTSNMVKRLAPGAVSFNVLSQFYPMKVNLDISTANNAFFDPSDRSLQIGDGVDDEIANLEKDIDVAAHEFGHFVETAYAPDQAPRLNSPRRAMGEGFGDFTAATVNGALASRGGQAGALCVGDSTIPLGGSTFTCLRAYSLSNPKRSPQDVQGEEHADGEIIAGALYALAALETSDTTSNFTTIDQGGLEDAYRCLLAGFQDLPRSGAQWSDLVDAMDSGDQRRTGGQHVARIQAAFARVGIVGKKAAPSASSQNVAPREIILGIGFDEAFTAGQLRRYFVRVPSAGGTALSVQVFSPSSSVLSTLFVAPNNYDAGTDVVSSIDAASGSRDEQRVDVDAAQARGFDAAGSPVTTATCRIGDDAFWLIDVVAVHAGTFSIVARDQNPTATQPGDLGTFTGTSALPTTTGAIPQANPLDVDLYFFRGTRGQVAEVKVVGAASLRPTVWLFDPSLHVLAADIDGKDSDAQSDGLDDNEATIGGQPLPRDGTYIIAVTAFAPDAGAPTTFGGYDLTVDQGVLPGTEIARDPVTSTFTAVTNRTVMTGQDVLFHFTINSSIHRMAVVIDALNETSTSDIDLLVTSRTGSNVQAEFSSQTSGALEFVIIDTGTTPSIRDSDVYFVVVRGFDVKPAGSAEAFGVGVLINEQLDASPVTNPPRRGGGGGGGCALTTTRGAGESMGLWLPTLALLGVLALRARRRISCPGGGNPLPNPPG